MKNKAIGVFDSGIGGLTVYRALKEKLPNEKVIYLGDTARLPYGTKSAETIIKFSEGNALFLLTKSVKIIVVACNSASSYALPYLQNKFDIPVVGVIEPGAEAAVHASKAKIGVIEGVSSFLVLIDLFLCRSLLAVAVQSCRHGLRLGCLELHSEQLPVFSLLNCVSRFHQRLVTRSSL